MATQTMPALEAEIDYDAEADEYQAGLTLEHYMESIPQSTQREITLASLALVKALRPSVHVFNETLVQYLRVPPQPGAKRLGKVVPDNMVVLYDGPLIADKSYNVPKQPAAPFLVLEYVSKSNWRKDYFDNKRMYESELRVPYYLLFDPDKQLLFLYEHDGLGYVPTPENAAGRLPIPELDLEVAILGRYVRFWQRGELLPLPGELLAQRDEARRNSERDRSAAETARRAEESAREVAESAMRKAAVAEERTRQLEEILRKAGLSES